MAKDFDELLETLPETAHDKFAKFVADTQQKGWVSTERMRIAQTVAAAQVAQDQADGISETEDTSNAGGDLWQNYRPSVASASSRAQDLSTAASASSRTAVTLQLNELANPGGA